MRSVGVKTDLIRLDMVVKDIHRIWSEVPSLYTQPKSLLAQSRAYVRSDVRKALNFADKARKLFQEESVLATGYNAISDNIDHAGENAKMLRSQYLRFLSEGDYKNAGDVLSKLTSSAGVSSGVGSHVSAELVSSDDNGCVVTLRNSGEYTIMVTRFDVSKGSERVKTDPRATFSVQPNSTRQVLVSASPSISLSMEYTEHGENHTLQTEL